jgi:hypothetical protein
MFRSISIASFAILALAISACGKGNGPAHNDGPAAPVPVAVGSLDLTTAKGLWVVVDDVREFRKTGRVDALCRSNPNVKLHDMSIAIDATGAIFFYTPKSWDSATNQEKLGNLSRTGRVSFPDNPEWKQHAQAKILGDSMIWNFKREDQGTDGGSQEFTRSTAEEMRNLTKALESCRGRKSSPNEDQGNGH